MKERTLMCPRLDLALHPGIVLGCLRASVCRTEAGSVDVVCRFGG
jgi:hypothetical protein